MHPVERRREVHDLAEAGLTRSEIVTATAIPLSTVRNWLTGRTPVLARDATCDACGGPNHDLALLPHREYAYLLGLYLGDGHLARHRRAVYRLAITLDIRHPLIAESCRLAMEEVMRGRSAHTYRRPQRGTCVVSMYSKQWPCLFPQHGHGSKHSRPIVLTDWQQRIADSAPRQLLRGLIHSDGCRLVNRVQRRGRTYEYPRYQFTNTSDDIRRIFCDACDLLGVQWRRMNAMNISVARRESVAILDDFIGPKS